MATILLGCETFLPVWSEPEIKLIDSALDSTSFTPALGINGELKMPDGSNVRRYVANILRDLQANILRDAEDDIKSLSVVIQVHS